MNDKKLYTTMRGNRIDVDLIKIKSGISAKEKDAGVIKREQFINDKRKRISKKRMDEMLNNQLEVSNRLNTKEVYDNINNVKDNLEDIQTIIETSSFQAASNKEPPEQDSKKIRKKK